MFKEWFGAIKVYGDRRMVQIFWLGFASALPLPLTMGTLSLWMAESGVNKATIGAFALVGLPYTLKFLWSPLMDVLAIPIVTRLLGRRRSWILLTQILLCVAFVGLGSTNPSIDPVQTAVWALMVSFFSASQDIVIDAFRVEILDKNSYGAGAATSVFGYRIGLLVSGAGALYMASLGSWFTVYCVMAALMSIGMITVLFCQEPKQSDSISLNEKANQSRLKTAVIEPFVDFMSHKNWLLILLFIICYKLGDAFLANMMNPFFVDIGFSKIEIANISKVFGLVTTLIGGFLGGLAISRYGIMKGLLYCGLLQMVSNLVFIAQAWAGHNIYMLMLTIAAENITGGMGTTAFVAYISSLCNQKYTATQYALLSSFSSTGRTLLSSGSGVLVGIIGWSSFFMLTSFIAGIGIIILLYLMHRIKLSQSLSEFSSTI